MNLIYCSNIKANSKSDFIRKYFEENCPETYYDNGSIQCLGRRRRSFLDLFSLLKGRFKTATKPELAKILISLMETRSVRSLYCRTIEKIVFYTTEMHPSNWCYSISDYNRNSEYDRNKDGIDCFSFNKILKLAKRHDLIDNLFNKK